MENLKPKVYIEGHLDQIIVSALVYEFEFCYFYYVLAFVLNCSLNFLQI